MGFRFEESDIKALNRLNDCAKKNGCKFILQFSPHNSDTLNFESLCNFLNKPRSFADKLEKLYEEAHIFDTGFKSFEMRLLMEKNDMSSVEVIVTYLDIYFCFDYINCKAELDKEELEWLCSTSFPPYFTKTIKDYSVYERVDGILRLMENDVKYEEMKEVYDVAEKYFHEVIERENRG